MKRLLTAVLAMMAFATTMGLGQAPAPSVPATTAPAPEPYVMVFLRRPADAPPRLEGEAGEALQRAHLGNMRKLADEDKLVCAGPFLDGTSLRGVFVLKTGSLDEARQWAQTDPMFQQNRLVGEFHLWPQRPGTFSKPPDGNPMENYAIVIYQRGEKFQPMSPALVPLAQRHIAYVRGLMSAGKLAAAGPFTGPGDELIGMFIVAGTVDEAKDIAAQDPFVIEGEARPEIHPWMSQKGVLAK